MTDTTAPTTVDADELTLLVGRDASTAPYLAYPVDLADPATVFENLLDLRRDGDGDVVLVGIEFDDPLDPRNRIVLAGTDLAAVEFTTAVGNAIPTDEVLDRLDDLDHITVAESE